MRLFFAVFLFLSAPLFSVVEVWDTQEMFCVQKIDEVKVSPDGKRLLFTSKTPVIEQKKSEWASQIFLSNLDGSELTPFTKKEGTAFAPDWSCDGKSIGYLSKEGEKIFLKLLPAHGGESETLTDGSQEVVAFKFSPDGTKIALVMKNGETPEEKKKKEEKEDITIEGENLKPSHLWILNLKNKELVRLTSGDFHVGTGFVGAWIDWSPNSQEIAFPRMPCPCLDCWAQGEIWIVNVDSKQLRKLETGGPAVTPCYSPDGKWIAYAVYESPEKWDLTSDIGITEASGQGTPKKLAQTQNRELSYQGNLIGWSANSDGVFVNESNNTKSTIFYLPLEGGPQKLDFGNRFIPFLSLNASKNTFGFVSETANCPREVFVKGVNSETVAQVTRLNEKLPLQAIGKTEVICFSAKDGMEIEALLTYPKGYETGKTYPLLLVIHGGPTSLYQESFVGNPNPYPLATFSSKGFAILRCNIRGSNGYGQSFRRANFRDWGGKDFEDLMSGVDEIISRGIANPEKLGVMGWSYGGYMTSWIITQTNRFKAASVGAGVINLASMAGTCDIRSFLPGHFGKELWEDFDLYLERSSISHVQSVTTPTLIQHGKGDERVPLSQSYELYTALKRKGVPTQLVIYPRSGHSIDEPKFLLDAAKRNLEWFEKFVQKN